MTTDARAALERLVAALEAHLTAAEQRRGEQDPHVELAYRTLADAFETYDEALYDSYDEVTPFVLYDEVEDQRDEEDEIDEDDEDEDIDEEDLSDDDADDLPELEDDEDESFGESPAAQSSRESTQETSSRA